MGLRPLNTREEMGTSKLRTPELMAPYETYVETLLVCAPEQDIEEIRTLLQNKFSKLEPTLRLQRGTTGTPHDDDMELKDYWLKQYGQIAEPGGYQLK